MRKAEPRDKPISTRTKRNVEAEVEALGYGIREVSNIKSNTLGPAYNEHFNA